MNAWSRASYVASGVNLLGAVGDFHKGNVGWALCGLCMVLIGLISAYTLERKGRTA